MLAKLRLRVATERTLDGFLGKITLRCGPKNVDLERIEKRMTVFAIDHDPANAIGRIVGAECKSGELYALAEVVDVPKSHGYLREIRAGLRDGVSPGFIIQKVEPSSKRDPKAGQYDLDVTAWQPYEVSSTPIPRNVDARIIAEV